METREVLSKDSQVRCPVCGKVTRCTLNFPLFDGNGSMKRITGKMMCQCEEEAEVREKEQQRRETDMEAVQRLKKLSFMDKRLRNASFSTYEVSQENQAAYNAAVRYVERFEEMLKTGQGLLFLGPVGTGKSYTAAAVANELMGRKHTAIMTSFVKLLNVMSQVSTADEEYLAMLNQADLMFIDELGAERGTDTALEKVYNVIDTRYRSCKPLILTTNLSMPEIIAEGDIRYIRIYDRVLEMCYPVEMTGHSLRKREASRRYTEMKRLLEG